jgi:hypothetical protein
MLSLASDRVKFVEIRDRHTFVAALAVQIHGEDHYLARHAGFESPMVYLIALATQRCAYDPWYWGDRTYHTAHLWLSEHWEEFVSGGVVDVEFILGERAQPHASAEFREV